MRGPSGVRCGAAFCDLGIIEDGSVLIRDGAIAAVGTTRRMENLKDTKGAIAIPVGNAVIAPGFVDPSIHLSLVDDGPNHLGRRKKLSDFYTESLVLMRSCLQHGTLTAGVKANAGNSDLHADLSVLRRLASIGNNPVEMVRSWEISALPGGESDTFNPFRNTLNALLDRNFARFIDLTPETCESLGRELALAIESGVVGINLRWDGGSPIQLANLVSRYAPRTVHCRSDVSPEEATVLSDASSIIVFSPTHEFLERRGGSGVRKLADAGAAIALSTGYHARHAPSFNMQAALSLAVLHLGLSPEEALMAATVNAAYAVGLGSTIGSLEVGKRADLLILNVPDYREIPRRFGINHVGMAIRDGNVVFNRTRWKVSAS
jgi:imidazolonepropionase